MTRTSFAIGIAVAALSSIQAMAADLGRFPPPAPFYPAAALLPVYNWTGCYLGAQLGGAFADNEINGPLAGFVFHENDSSAGVLAGGQVGCDLQFARNWVIGAQIDGAWVNLTANEGLTGSQSGSLNLIGNLTFKTNVIATATGRIGYALNYDSIAGLFYLKGGAAFKNSDTPNFNARNGVNLETDFSAPSPNQWGWTIGLGTEWAVFENWSIFGEWDYMNFGTNNVTFTNPDFGS